MPGEIFPILAVCLLLAAPLDAQQVVFSHRAYAAQGRTYQQLWIWTPEGGEPKQISHSRRDHRSPTCDADGRHTLFDSQNDDLTITRWRLDRTTGAEERVDATGPSALHDAGPSPTPTACDADTAQVSPDRTRIACVVTGTDVLIADAPTRDPIVRVPFGQRYSTGEPYAPWPMQISWSPDGRTLLVGNYGEHGSSTTGELDYFLLDLEPRTWTRAFTGTDALWLTPTLVVYITPRDLSPLTAGSAHSVWTAHLTAFYVTTHRSRPITSGLSNDLTPTVCSAR
ncbi:MAG TPA: hypothetical protein VFA59_10090 [Vicinamibacterales bacterium]|nr:hypothetical protein [Vicinamibacterales bacterium]